MPDDDQIRAGLVALAAQAPTGGDPEAAKSQGRRRLRTRRLGQAGVATTALLIGGIGLVQLTAAAPGPSTIEAAGTAAPAAADAGVATSGTAEAGASNAGVPDDPVNPGAAVDTPIPFPPDDGSNPDGDSAPAVAATPQTTIPEADSGGDDPSTSDDPAPSDPDPTDTTVTTDPESTNPTPTQPDTTEWTPPPDDPGQPSPAAIDANTAFRVVPAGLADCGTRVLSSGWPTTTATPPGITDCIVDAAATGQAAQFSYSTRDHANGAWGRIYRVEPGGTLVVIAYTVDPSGRVASDRTPCSGFATVDEYSYEVICQP